MRFLRSTLAASMVMCLAAAQSVAEIQACPVPQLSILAVSDGNVVRVTNPSRHRFRSSDQLVFQVQGAFTGHYTVIYLDAENKLVTDTFTYADSSRSYLLPCGYEFLPQCEIYALESTGRSRDYDDFTIIYTPCFSGESSARNDMMQRLPQESANFPRCTNRFKARFSQAELQKVLQQANRQSGACETITDKAGNTGVVKRIQVGFD